MNDEIKEFNEEKYVEMLENGELYDYITNLQQENERIKKMNMHEHKYGSDMEEKYLIEKAKNDRAVECLKQTRGNHSDLHYEPIKVITLINILNGRSDE